MLTIAKTYINQYGDNAIEHFIADLMRVTRPTSRPGYTPRERRSSPPPMHSTFLPKSSITTPRRRVASHEHTTSMIHQQVLPRSDRASAVELCDKLR